MNKCTSAVRSSDLPGLAPGKRRSTVLALDGGPDPLVAEREKGEKEARFIYLREKSIQVH
jgi:hypothetical protein